MSPAGWLFTNEPPGKPCLWFFKELPYRKPVQGSVMTEVGEMRLVGRRRPKREAFLCVCYWHRCVRCFAESCGCVSDSMNVRLRRLAMALSLFSVSWNYPVTAKTSLDPPVFPTVLHVLVFLFLLLMTCLLRGGQLITHGAVHFHTRLSTQCTLMPR